MFYIDNKSKAEWFMRKLFLMDKEIESVTNQSALILTRLKNARLKFYNHFAKQAEEWLRGEIRSGEIRGKTVSTFYGSAQLRKSPEKLSLNEEVEGNTSFFEQNYPEYVKVVTTLTIDKRGFLTHATSIWKETGVLLPGCVVKPETEELAIIAPGHIKYQEDQSEGLVDYESEYRFDL